MAEPTQEQIATIKDWLGHHHFINPAVGKNIYALLTAYEERGRALQLTRGCFETEDSFGVRVMQQRAEAAEAEVARVRLAMEMDRDASSRMIHGLRQQLKAAQGQLHLGEKMYRLLKTSTEDEDRIHDDTWWDEIDHLVEEGDALYKAGGQP